MRSFHVQPLYIAGNGRVGKALRRHFTLRHIPYKPLPRNWEGKPPQEGILFLAIPDAEVERVLREIYSVTPPSLRIVHFSAAFPSIRRRVHLLHPFASIGHGIELADLLFLWAGHQDNLFRRFLNEHEFHFFYSDTPPGPGYHTAAVLIGNFTQYLYLASRHILEHEGFSSRRLDTLLKQLVDTSLFHVRTKGIAGITGPAARSDDEVTKQEALFLEATMNAPRLANVYRETSWLITKAVRNGSILG